MTLIKTCAISLALTATLIGPAGAALDLRPVADTDWTPAHARHLASRAGFGARPDELAELAQIRPADAIGKYINGQLRALAPLLPFEHSGVFDEGLDPFPPSRPATTEQAKRDGHALGVSVKPGGNRPLQPVVNKFFYWLRASRLETDRVAYWWANRMLSSGHPLREKMALFWHGHFATNEDKVRDYRKMFRQLQLFRSAGLGNFRDLIINVAQDPAMLVFLDAGVNTKDSPNENFAREIMELFTMGVGNYGEQDVQEAARAFTGWNFSGLKFRVVAKDHDTDPKKFLDQQGNFDGVEIIDIILKQPVAAEFIAGKLYRYFVNEQLSGDDQRQLGAVLRAHNYDIAGFLKILFASRDFYRPANRASRIKSPVELLVSTYRQLGLNAVPGVPDFNLASDALGQRLMHPPTVAGWSHGRSWITPSLMFERSNFALDVLFPDVGFIANDRYPGFPSDEIVHVQNRLRQGMSISAATKPTGVGQMMAASNLLADRDEDFNTRLGTMRGWQMAIERVIPIERTTAKVSLTEHVVAASLQTPRAIVNHFAKTFFVVALAEEDLIRLSRFLADELGGEDISGAATYMEEPLRKMLHQMLSLPEYQLG